MSTALVVDLDGTLIKTDLLVEGLLSALKHRPWLLACLPFWLAKGKAHFKDQVARYAQVDPALLPYQSEVLKLIEARRQSGDHIILATAAHRTMAELVAGYLGCFNEVLASTAMVNMAGREKLRALERQLRLERFAYAGNSRADLPIWAVADEVIVVEPNAGVLIGLRNRLKREPQAVIGVPGQRWRAMGRAMRLHQWMKNTLVFVPLIAAQVWHQADAWLTAGLLFLAFGLTASSIYIFNDLMDLDADRRHPRKRTRPFAAGEVPLLYGVVMSPIIICAGLAIAMAISLDAFFFLLSYAAASLAYGLYFKRFVVLDVMFLAGLYTVRVLAGAAALEIEPSFWLLAFSMFLFLGLAVMKRTAELELLAQRSVASTAGRDYRVTDADTVRTLGIASSYVSVLVLAMYINAPEVAGMYASLEPLWGVCIALLYWLGRLWVKTGRGEMHDDPVVFALRDWNSRILAFLCAGCVLLATTQVWS